MMAPIMLTKNKKMTMFNNPVKLPNTVVCGQRCMRLALTINGLIRGNANITRYHRSS